ncbi:MAG: pentapeptide repeat-containing protein [Desulfobulbaceae bacterium]|nr:pentapeptide repeat-containing protein [Desulfobulbaceae bacterium]
MRTTTLALVIIPLLFLLGGCGAKAVDKTIAAGGKKLAATELNRLVAGNTLHMEEYGMEATVECFTDGKLSAANSDKTRSVGRWQIDGQEQLCLRFKRLGGSEEYCSAVYQVDEQYRQFTASGALIGTFTVTEGTSKNQPGAGAAAAPDKRQAAEAGGAAPAPGRQQAESPAYPRPLPKPEIHAETDIRFFYVEMAKNCPGCNLAGVNLEEANLMGARLAGADLRKTILRKANLRQADLRGANLAGCDLTEANLVGADLAGADLTGADLTGANLNRANLHGASLEGAKGADPGNAIR